MNPDLVKTGSSTMDQDRRTLRLETAREGLLFYACVPTSLKTTRFLSVRSKLKNQIC